MSTPTPEDDHVDNSKVLTTTSTTTTTTTSDIVDVTTATHLKPLINESALGLADFLVRYIIYGVKLIKSFKFCIHLFLFLNIASICVKLKAKVKALNFTFPYFERQLVSD